MQFSISVIPDEIIKQYNLRELEHDGKVYIEIQKGMYSLPQAGILAHNLLIERLKEFGYYPVEFTLGLW
jgi:hypothetical protein